MRLQAADSTIDSVQIDPNAKPIKHFSQHPAYWAQAHNSRNILVKGGRGGEHRNATLRVALRLDFINRPISGILTIIICSESSRAISSPRGVPEIRSRKQMND